MGTKLDHRKHERVRKVYPVFRATVPFEVIVSWGSGARFGITETAKMLPRGVELNKS